MSCLIEFILGEEVSHKSKENNFYFQNMYFKDIRLYKILKADYWGENDLFENGVRNFIFLSKFWQTWTISSRAIRRHEANIPMLIADHSNGEVNNEEERYLGSSEIKGISYKTKF